MVTQRIVPAVRASRDKSDLLFDLLLAVLQSSGAPVMRLADDFTEHPVWKGGLHIALTDLLRELKVLGDSLTLVSDRLQGGEKRDDTLMLLVNELRAVTRRLDGCAEGLMLALRPPATAEPMVRWLEVKGREGNVAVTAVPLDLAPILRDDLFSRVKTAVVTSATLGTEGDFEFVARRFGLDGRAVSPTHCSVRITIRLSVAGASHSSDRYSRAQRGCRSALQRCAQDHRRRRACFRRWHVRVVHQPSRRSRSGGVTSP